MTTWLDKSELVKKDLRVHVNYRSARKKGAFPPRFVDLTNRVKWDDSEVKSVDGRGYIQITKP